MAAKIRVAFFAETLKANYDGAVRTMYQIIKRIPKEQFEFLFFCGDTEVDPLPFQTIVLPSFTIPFNRKYKMILPFLARQRLAQQLNQFQPDIIHIATPSPLGHCALRYAKNRAIPVLSIYHTHFVAYIDYYLKNTPFLIDSIKYGIVKNYKAFYDQCDIVYAPTTPIIEDLKNLGHQTSHFKIWQRGVDSQLFHPSKSNRSWLAAKVGNAKPTILFASRLVWEKNLDTLLAFYQLNQERGAAYNIIIAGDGVAKATLVQAMPSAHFLGNLSHQELAIVYASSDVFFFPSISETYGNVVVEAMASGLPCVIANGGGSKKLIKQGINGFLCSPNNPEEYFERIQQLLTHPTLYQQFVAEGLAFSKDLNWDSLVDKYFEELKMLKAYESMRCA